MIYAAYVAVILPAVFLSVFSLETYVGQSVVKCQLTPDLGTRFHNVTELMDVWGCNGQGECDIRIRDQTEKATLLDFFDGQCEVMIPDLQANMEQFETLHAAARANYLAGLNASHAFPHHGWFDTYHPLDETDHFWAQFAHHYDGHRGVRVHHQTIGSTHEDRPIYGIKIVTKPSNPWMYFQCQIHAREWISGATCQWILNEMLMKHDPENPSSIFNQVSIAVTTVANPDGYAYTWSNARLWRKNRWPCPNGQVGVDLNRNYDDHWGQGGSSSQCSSDTYMGPAPESEKETQATVKFFESLFADGHPIYGAIDWHAYSQLVLRPYGWTNADSPDEAAQKAIGDAYAAAVYEVHGRRYTSQRSIGLYVTTGTANDWFYGTGSDNNPGYRAAGFTLELRPLNQQQGGFELPPSQIVATAEENYAGLQAWLRGLIANPLIKDKELIKE